MSCTRLHTTCSHLTLLAFAHRRKAIALVVLVLAAASVQAQAVIIRNDMSFPVIMQGSCIVRDVVRRGPPVQMQSGQAVRIDMPGYKFITIRDANRPDVFLCRKTIPPAAEELHYAIVPDMVGRQVILRRIQAPPAPPRPPFP